MNFLETGITPNMNLYKFILEHIKDIVMLLNKKGEILYVNDEAINFYGYTKDEILSKTIFEFREDDRSIVKKQIESTLRGNFSFETYHKRKDGTKVPVEVRAVSVKDEDEDYIISIVRDIEEKKLLEDNLRKNYIDMERLKEEAEKANQIKSQFLARVSHEIRTPMNAIVGIGDLLSKTSMTDEQKEYISLMKESTERLLELMNNMLDMARIDKGKLDVKEELFDLKEIIDGIVDDFSYLGKEKDITVKRRIEFFIDTKFIGDKARLSQIIINLMNNALKFTKEGEIVLSVKKLGEEDNKAFLEFCIEDTGIGISKEEQEELLSGFFYGRIKKQSGGLGLGLSISKEIVRVMGGELWFESKENEGSKFFFSIEIKIPSITISELEEVSTSQKLEGKKLVLVVEDNEINKKIVSAYLEMAGYEVVNASNGQEAIEVVSTREFDLVLMDIQMPVMNGYEAAKAIREAKKKMPIIAMTAYSISDDEKMSKEAGMDDYITKPFDSVQLYEKLKRHIEK